MTLAKLLTTEQVADLTALSVPTICKAIRTGELAARKIGRRYRVEPAAVKAWLDAQPTNDLARELVERAS